MTRRMVLLLTAAIGPALGGCVAGMAMGAAGTAIQAAQGHPKSNAHLQPTAKEACSANAASYGAVHIIDVEQRSADRIIVWGTVDDGKKRQSFECGFRTAITYFKLRDIRPRR